MSQGLYCVCEGITDEAVLRRMLQWAGGPGATVHSTSGKARLFRSMTGYVNLSRRQPCFVLVDLDREECAPAALRSLSVTPGEGLCVRFAVRAVESWLMADREGFAKFLGVGTNRLPMAPDTVEDPVAAVLSVARRSRWRWVREDLLPRPGSGRKRGPGYASRLIEFTTRHWNVDEARRHSPSLEGALACLQRILETTS